MRLWNRSDAAAFILGTPDVFAGVADHAEAARLYRALAAAVHPDRSAAGVGTMVGDGPDLAAATSATAALNAQWRRRRTSGGAAAAHVIGRHGTYVFGRRVTASPDVATYAVRVTERGGTGTPADGTGGEADATTRPADTAPDSTTGHAPRTGTTDDTDNIGDTDDTNDTNDTDNADDTLGTFGTPGTGTGTGSGTDRTAGDRLRIHVARRAAANAVALTLVDVRPRLAAQGMSGFVPEVLDSGRTAGRAWLVTRVPADLLSMRDVLRLLPAGLDGRDWAWIARRLLMTLDAAGATHGALDLDTVLVAPEAHGIVVTGWTGRGRDGPALARLFEEVLGSGIRDDRQRRFAERAADLEPRRALTEYDLLLSHLYGERRYRPFPVKGTRAARRTA